MKANLQDLITLIEDQFENGLDFIPREEITEETPFRDVVEWDSIGALAVLVAIENAYSINMTINQLKELQTFKDLIKFID